MSECVTLADIFRAIVKHAVQYQNYETVDNGRNVCVLCGESDTFESAEVTHARDCPVVLMEWWLEQEGRVTGEQADPTDALA